MARLCFCPSERPIREQKRTAELVLEHIQRHGSRSLGVITFNLRQQLAVLDKRMELRKNRPDLKPFFREDHMVDVSNRSGEPDGVSPQILSCNRKCPGADAARLT